MPTAEFPTLGLTPFHCPDPRLAIALLSAGQRAVLDLGAGGADARRALAAVDRFARERGVTFGVRVREASGLCAADLPAAVDLVLLSAPADASAWNPRQVLVQVVSIDEARAAVDAGADGVIAVGSEGAGRVGDESTFVLFQRLVAALPVPVWAQGGIGPHTVAACLAGGAAGVVVDTQLALVREAGTPAPVRAVLAAADGSETTTLAGRRVFTRPDLELVRALRDAPSAEVDAHLGCGSLDEVLLPVGQDLALAAHLAERHGTAAGVMRALARSASRGVRLAREHAPLAAGSALALRNGTRYPVVQGPMTRVSDRAAFARAIADGGGLPFLALALMRGPDARVLLKETAALMGDHPWGVGILGFVPAELRAEQTAVIEEVRPPFAIIAGGRPSQARSLEERGIATFLHVPSPGLLEMFLKEGARRFIFEGRECGGHVGPRGSFALWESQLSLLEAFDRPEELSVLFAGGLTDGRSGAMVSALAAPLAARGAAVGGLMGTAYLFTEEAVQSGAIQAGFQDVAVTCERTVLLETAPGHATRCADSEYVRAFRAERARLEGEGYGGRDLWERLERMNLGRLRVASKGLRREGDDLVRVSSDEERAEGLYMIGQVATMRDRVTTIEALHQDLCEGASEHLSRAHIDAVAAEPAASEPAEIAVVGMACLFPGAPDLGTFWSNLVHGVDCVGEVPSTRWDPELYYDPDGEPGMTTPSKWGGFLDRVAFEPAEYGIPPRSLASIEPVQLLSLEVARRALEDAGYSALPDGPGRAFDRERTAVIFGAEGGTELAGGYGFRALFPQYAGELPEELEAILPEPTEDSFPGVLANVIAGRVANRLDLGGMNFTVDAACASSLAAVEVAVQSLLAGSSGMALVGGADLHNSIGDYLMFSSVHALSRKGRCAAFDSEADGITLGEGVGVVVLKRLSDARRDGDRVYAVIQAIAGSSDGRSLGLTAPRKEGQVRAVERAYAGAGLSPACIGLVEAHGTGTVVGDRTELETLDEVFRGAGAPAGAVALGSVKSQLGHTKCAAGIASLMKVSLALYHRVLPPTLHVANPNSGWDEGTSPFRFGASARPWARPERAAALSAFGFGGTNFHAVVTERPDADADLDADAGRLSAWPAELFLVRGADRAAAVERLEALARLAGLADAPPMRELARATSTGGEGPVQVAVVAAGLDELRAALEPALALEARPGSVFVRDEQEGAVAFLFPGQGSQRPGMLAELFAARPELSELLALGAPWADRIWPSEAYGEEARAARDAALTDTRVAQPALGLCDLAMARVLGDLGVEPALSAGHSYGELAALAASGALAPADLLPLSEARAEAILAAAGEDPGAMAAVSAERADVEAALRGVEDVVVANHNAPRQTVIAGPTPSIEAALELLASDGRAAKLLPVACAFHSPVVAAAQARFEQVLTKVHLQAPRTPVYSNVTAAPHADDPDAIRARLVEQLARPVEFVREVEAMYDAGARVFVEVGPGGVLTGLVGRILGDRPHLAVATDTRGRASLVQLQLALAQIACAGVALDTDALYAGRTTGSWDVLGAPAMEPSGTAWWVNGHRAWPVHGEPPRAAMVPVTRPPVELVPRTEPTVAVTEYLRNLRAMVDAQRDVVLGYLGADVARTAPPPDLSTPALRPAAATNGAEAPAPVPAPGDGPERSLEEVLLDVVAERTGYPVDMLGLDLDLEADLGVDSIKRIEILGALGNLSGLDVDAEDGRDDLVEELASIKTLRGILTWIEEHGDSEAAPAEEGVETVRTITPAARVEPVVGRYALRVEATEPPGRNGHTLAGKTVALVPDDRGVAKALESLLLAEGATVRRVERNGSFGDADALLHLASLAAEPEDVKWLFRLAQEALAVDAPWIVAATGMGGAFGRGANGHGRPGQGGVAGLLKSLAKERPDAHVRAVDLDLDEPAEALARHVFDELLAGDDHIEVGYKGGERRVLSVVQSDIESAQEASEKLDRDSVVLLTGGARGITAHVAIALARRFRCRLELVGRTPLGDEEDAELAAARDAAGVRGVLIGRHSGEKPAEIEQRVRGVLARREVVGTLAAVRDAGGRAGYHAVDVRDDGAFGGLIEEIYGRLGRIDGVIHAAGVVEDKLIVHKSPESFDRVFDTKVRGALTLAEKLRPDVRFVVFFSSISAFGNRGQADYAAANDVLDKLAHHLDECLEARILSINWGPWDSAGMVSPELRREYERRGVALIPMERGSASLVEELASGGKGEAQLILTSAAPEVLA